MLRLTFGLFTPYPAEEEQFLQELMTPGSPQFNNFLTPDQWTARFGPAVADEQAVVDWATSHGLTITQGYPNRLTVHVEAPLATIENALQVTINNYQLNGYTYFGNEGAPVLPGSVGSIIRSLEGLHNFTVMQPSTAAWPIPPGPIYTPGPVVGEPTNEYGRGCELHSSEHHQWQLRPDGYLRAQRLQL